MAAAVELSEAVAIVPEAPKPVEAGKVPLDMQSYPAGAAADSGELYVCLMTS